ncbi:PREDICTED: leucine-rich repeat neuronal protein 4 [Ficedula albicollis]|uniref:Leucine rich repeat neuronal 4 n=1 Tax=Ficedula albicollis TaxID=59894 RepID=A0A803VL45_FICAL|nr:PREDICTED: leucine-rich repeat neuronal protein 4 [Ficedula albicollis]
MISPLLILPLLLGTTAHSPVSRAASRDVTTFFQLAQEDTWENVNLTSMSCEYWKNRTWITLQLTNSSLTTFPVCLPEALQSLDLSNNLLEEVNGTEIANLPQLRVLSLRHNHLWSVRWGSEALSSLLKLDLSFNKLSSVPSCHGSALPNLKWLSLAGNPLIEIQPLAFSCYPQLHVLNLSATLLGKDDSRGIRDSAFAISTDPNEAMNRTANSISVLDLSRTFFEKIEPEWARDLANLRLLHLTNMPRLRSLDGDFFKFLPGLQELHCQDSHSLSFVQTEMFDSAPHLSHLSFENCNLSFFNPWNTNSSEGITINLSGNSLLCDCQLSWLLSKPEKVVLQKAGETFCTSQEDSGRHPTPFSLLELYNKCQSESNVTLPDSNTALPDHDSFNFTSDETSAVVTTDSALLTTDLTHSSSLIHGDVMSTAASNPMLTKDTSSSSLIQWDVRSTAASNSMLTKDTSSSSLIQWDVRSTAASNSMLTKDTSSSSLIQWDVRSTAASNSMLTKDTSSSSLIQWDVRSTAASNSMLTKDTSSSSLIQWDVRSTAASNSMLTKDTSSSSLIQWDVRSTAASNSMLTKDTSSSSLIQWDVRSTAASNSMLTKDTSSSSLIQWDVRSTAGSNPMLTKDTYTSSLTQGDVRSTEASNPTEPILAKANSSSHEQKAVSESTSNPPSSASVTSFPVFFQEFFAQTPDHSSTSPTGTEQPQRGLRTTHTTFPREGTFSQTTSGYSTGGAGVPHTTNHPTHSFATHGREGAPQTSPPQVISTRSRAHSEAAGSTPPPHYTDDYDYEDQPKEPPVHTAHVACDYNPCRHLQKPCKELQNITQCSCPGTSREDEIPDPPRLREVIEITDSSAQIRWCAPYSVVHSYELVLRAQDSEDRQIVMDNIYPTARQYTLYNLLPFTTYHICVSASNKAGSSQKTGQEIPGNSCTSFKTKPSYKYVFAGLSAASGLFLITTIILSVCLCKACKKPQSEQYGTHLVSYKNPAFDYPLKLQTTN